MKKVEQPPGSLPEAFEQRLQALLPVDRQPVWWRAFAAPPPAAFRVNTLLAAEAAVVAEVRAAELEPRPLDWPAGAWVVPPAQRRALIDTEAARTGRAYVQNPSSMVPVAVLDPQPGEEILDLAAAPGGKTIHLAARMGNEGRIAAVEAVRGRYHRLRRNLARCGVSVAQTYLADGTGVGRKVPERFDRVLLDAPCSSEGRFRAHDPASWQYWGPRKIREMARKQKRLAIAAAQALKPGGVLVYCTCTLAPEENEAIVDALLRRWPGALEVEPVDLPAGSTGPGLTDWAGRDYDPAVAGCARIWPDETHEGFFLARLRKREATP